MSSLPDVRRGAVATSVAVLLLAAAMGAAGAFSAGRPSPSPPLTGAREDPPVGVPPRANASPRSSVPAASTPDWGSQGYTWDPLDNQTVPGVVTPYVGADPSAVAFDPLENSVWVGFGAAIFDAPDYWYNGYGPPIVEVVNATTDRVETVLSTDAQVSAIAYDPANRDMYVATVPINSEYDGAGVLQVFNATSGQLVNASIGVGPAPMGLLYVPATQTIWVSSVAYYDIDVISSATNEVVATLAYDQLYGPWGMAYDPANGDVYVAGVFLSNIYVLNATTGDLLGFSIGDPLDYGYVVYDPVNQLLYAYGAGLMSQGTSLEVISGVTQSPVASITMPDGTRPVAAVVDPTTGNLWVSIESQTLPEVGGDRPHSTGLGAGESVPRTISADTAPGPGDVIEVLASNDTVGPVSLPSESGCWFATLDPTTDEAYFANTYGTQLVPVNVSLGSEDRPLVSLVTAPTDGAWDASDGLAYITDPAGGGLLRIDPVTGTGAGAEIPLGPAAVNGTLTSSPGAIVFAPDVDELLVANQGNDSIWLLNASSGAVIDRTWTLSSNVSALAYDPVSGDVLVGTENATLLTLDPGTGVTTSVANLTASPSSLLLNGNSTIAWATGSGPGGCEGFANGVDLSDGAILQTTTFGGYAGEATFDPAANAVYSASPGSISGGCGGGMNAFNASVGGGANDPHLGISSPATVAYDPANEALYVGGSLSSAGSVQAFNGSTNSSDETPGPIFGVSGAPNFLLATPEFGTVLGLDATDGDVQGITLDPTILAASASPAAVDVGVPFHVEVTVGGGAGGYSYSYAGLPTSCAGGNVSNFSCTPSSAGTYHATVTVTDAVGSTALRLFSVVVVADPTIAVVADPPRVVLGDPVGLFATVGGGLGLLNVTWTFGDGTNGYGESVAHLYTRAGSFLVGAEVRDADGMTASGSVAVEVGVPFSVLAIAAPVALLRGGNVTVNVSADGGVGPYEVEITFGDGNRTSVGLASPGAFVRVVHPYTVAGTFSLDVWVNDSANDSSVTVFLVNVTAPTTHPPPPPPPAASSGPNGAAGLGSPVAEYGLGAAVAAAAAVLGVALVQYFRLPRPKAPGPGPPPNSN